MLIQSFDQVPQQPMTMPGASGVQMRLIVGKQHGAPNFSMRMFEVAPGGHTPLHSHNYEHEVMILGGEAEIGGTGQGRRVSAGDALFIPAGEMHQFRNVGSIPLIFMCMVPSTFDCSGACTPTPGS